MDGRRTAYLIQRKLQLASSHFAKLTILTTPLLLLAHDHLKRAPMPLPRRYSRPVVVIAFALCLALFVLVGKRGSHTDWATNGRRLGPHAFLKSSGQLSTGYAEAAHLTTVLAHQPGFTLFKNL